MSLLALTPWLLPASRVKVRERNAVMRCAAGDDESAERQRRREVRSRFGNGRDVKEDKAGVRVYL